MPSPALLRIPEVAQLVADAIPHQDVELEHYRLRAFVVMPARPRIPRHAIAKGYTAREANKLLERTGHPLWRRESYDHWVRNERESHRIVHYIENNPVNASLAPTPEAFPWSSAATHWPNKP